LGLLDLFITLLLGETLGLLLFSLWKDLDLLPELIEEKLGLLLAWCPLRIGDLDLLSCLYLFGGLLDLLLCLRSLYFLGPYLLFIVQGYLLAKALVEHKWEGSYRLSSLLRKDNSDSFSFKLFPVKFFQGSLRISAPEI
jgi:hypothetical protein